VATLQIRAKRLRYETKNWALHAKADENRVDFNSIMTIYLLGPFVMFIQEPILALMTAYMSFIYGYAQHPSSASYTSSSKPYVTLLPSCSRPQLTTPFPPQYPISFVEQRGWNLGVGSLPFAAFIVGIMMGTGGIAYSTSTNFKRAFIKHGKPIPEERLPPMIIGAIALPIGLFWFAWQRPLLRAAPHFTLY
jgi:hypothetical protein